MDISLKDEIGRVRRSSWLLVDQTMIDRFADATFDHQYIHVDSTLAADTPFGGTVAHGFLILSLIPFFAQTIEQPDAFSAKMQVNYGLEKVRFVSPVRSGSRIRAASKLIAVSERSPGEYQQTHEWVIEIEGQEKPAMIAISISLLIF